MRFWKFINNQAQNNNKETEKNSDEHDRNNQNTNNKNETIIDNDKPRYSKQHSDKTNQFLKELENLPDFSEKDCRDGYSIDTDGYTEFPEGIIRTLITKFFKIFIHFFTIKNVDYFDAYFKWSGQQAAYEP